MGVLVTPAAGWLNSEDSYDQAVMQEWLDEARNPDATLAELVGGYLRAARRFVPLRGRARGSPPAGPGGDGDPILRALAAQQRVAVKREEIYQHLRALGEPPTKMYPGGLPLFPIVYRLEVRFDATDLEVPVDLDDEDGLRLGDPVVWDSGLEPSSGQYRESTFPLEPGARVMVRYQLRAWNKRQRDAQQRVQRVWQLGLLAIAATGFGLAWVLRVQADERERRRQREQARLRLEQAERHRLEEEGKRVETERQLLEQRLATQAAEQKALELKSQVYASIGIMAGSYAHNIKNLLVRPNDLLRRCLERADLPAEQGTMLHEVQGTLATVTERLQQILQTVRRDPSRSQPRELDLNAVLRSIGRTWGDLATDRWQLDLALDLSDGALPIRGDESHLLQAIENLLFNARDATFEMRNHLRENVRRDAALDATTRKRALIAAAAWRGRVTVRSRRADGADRATLEVVDNGIGMTDEVRRRCTETHFSTKRDNALYEGHSTGMGLGLAFVVAILDNHGATLEVDSTPQKGATFRVRFPLVGTDSADKREGT
ncbi:MAG: HAMP domain-containing sensor histidine kinase [Gemmataceae bacterium]